MDGEASRNVSVATLQDDEEEAAEAYAVRLVAARGGARVSESHSAVILTGTQDLIFLEVFIVVIGFRNRRKNLFF